jgi:hypothetical protein
MMGATAGLPSSDLEEVALRGLLIFSRPIVTGPDGQLSEIQLRIVDWASFARSPEP